MYDELVERLRAGEYTLEELSIILPKAANAIEELAAFKAQITDGRFYVAMGGALFELKNDPRTIRISSPEFIGPPKEE